MSNSENESTRRISVSTEILRNEIDLALSKLELRLMDKFVQKTDISRIENVLADHTKKFELIETEVEALRQDKAGRDAIDSYKRYFFGGGFIIISVMLLQLVVSSFLVLHH